MWLENVSGVNEYGPDNEQILRISKQGLPDA
jgi:hypothetical protein